MQRDADYLRLKEELAFAETAVQEVEAKLQIMNSDLGKMVDQLQQVLYIRAQTKKQKGTGVEYIMPKDMQETATVMSRQVRG